MKKNIKINLNQFFLVIVIVFCNTFEGFGQESISDATYKVAVLQYRGGGDWYANPTSLPNLVRFCNDEIGMNIDEDVPYVEVSSTDLSLFPFIHMTGHGNVVFSSTESRNLRNYLLAGGFLHISDNYGMDAYIRKEFVKVFPELEWKEIPFNHEIYHQTFNFNDGLPKIHEHNDLAPRGWGLFYEGRLVCFYDFECDLGDGWEDYQVHRDPESVRLLALEMGANIIQFALGGTK